MEELFTLFGSMAGVAILISFIVGALKKFGVIKDGQSAAWHKGLQLVAFLLVGVVDIFGFGIDLAAADEIAGLIAQVGTLLLGLAGMFGIGGATYTVTKGRIPLVGYTYSGK
jgi:hypothetical protein